MYLTSKEVMALLKISRRTLTYWTALGRIESVKIGGCRRYLATGLLSRRSPPAAP
jgi:excisionase family DNA binding protein